MPLEEKVILEQEQVEDDNLTDEFERISDESEKASILAMPLERADEEGGSEIITGVTQNDDIHGSKIIKSEKTKEENHRIDKLVTMITDCTVAQKELETKVIQTLKENVNFQIQVRQNMQKELEDAKKKLSGDIFVPLLKEIAELYVEWSDIIDELEGVSQKKVAGIFEILQEILEENGCVLGTSEINSKRRTKYSKLKNKILTSDKTKHETIAKSYNPWIVKEPFILYPEYVDVYVFKQNDNDSLKDSQVEQEEQPKEIENNEFIRGVSK